MKEKDILKSFVEDNMEAFDEHVPNADVFSKIQSQLGMKSLQKPKTKVVAFRYWWAAAAVLLLVMGAIVFLLQEKVVDNTLVVKNPTHHTSHIAITNKKDSFVVAKTDERNVAKKEQPVRKKIRHKILKTTIQNANTDSGPELLASNTVVSQDWRKELQNTNSSAARLAAVLASGKQNGLSVDDMQTLAYTMNNDESSNVRLAALDVLSKQRDQPEVKQMILQSVVQQDDPIVQMELLSMLSPDDAATVKKQLLDITENPTNIEAVRDQAYAALLRSKTNF
ncbi:MAG: hypothetical protein QM610_03750 [Chitinophagaceae bacterium]